MIIRYFLNGVFLFVLYVLLFHNMSFITENQHLPNRNFNYLFAKNNHPDTIISNLKNEHLLISEMQLILDRVEKEQLSETMNGLAILYGVSKQAQRKINEGIRTEPLDYVIAKLEQHTFIIEIPKSDWGKFTDYFKDCLFENLRCDHLINRVTRHEYFPAALVFCSLLLSAFVFLVFNKRIGNILKRIKLRQNETIDHTIPLNTGNQ